MAKPSELIRRAKQNRRRHGLQERMPAPAFPELPVRPLPTRHASYTRLMQNHDRIRTRHLTKSGGTGIT